MKYVRTKDGKILIAPELYDNGGMVLCSDPPQYETRNAKNEWGCVFCHDVIKIADTIEELCDCFVKIKRKGNCKPYILKFDYKDLPTLREQAIKYKDSPVYGAIYIEDKGLIFVAKMNDEEGELELL